MGILIFIGWVCVIYLLMTCAMAAVTIPQSYLHGGYRQAFYRSIGVLITAAVACVLVAGLVGVM